MTKARPAPDVTIAPAAPGQPQPNLQQAANQLGDKGGGVIHLKAGTYQLRGTLRLPAGVSLACGAAILQVVQSESYEFRFPTSGAWGTGVGGIHTAGDEMEYQLTVPATGKWQVWLRYATDMAPWGQDGVSGKHSLRVDDGTPVPLENLPNTGSFGLPSLT
jgi:hypothetical protein